MFDTSTIHGAGEAIRSLVVERSVDADPMSAWRDWTSSRSLAEWWPVKETRIDLRVGGPIEMFFDPEAPPGDQGSEGCRFLSYVPGEMVSFTWNAPPHLSLRKVNTWVVITFSRRLDESTDVRLVHTGFLEGEDWNAYMSYFESAWSYVLDLQVEHHAGQRASDTR